MAPWEQCCFWKGPRHAIAWHSRVALSHRKEISQPPDADTWQSNDRQTGQRVSHRIINDLGQREGMPRHAEKQPASFQDQQNEPLASRQTAWHLGNGAKTEFLLDDNMGKRGCSSKKGGLAVCCPRRVTSTKVNRCLGQRYLRFAIVSLHLALQEATATRSDTKVLVQSKKSIRAVSRYRKPETLGCAWRGWQAGYPKGSKEAADRSACISWQGL